MAGAAYQVNATVTDDESFGFTCEWKIDDGTDFPWADFTYEYEIGAHCSPSYALTVGSGLTIDPDANLISFQLDADQRLSVGQHPHGCRLTDIATGRVLQVFDGTITVTDGNF